MRWNGEPLPAILKPVAGMKIATRDVMIPSPQGPIRGRIYTPEKDPNAPGVVLVHGLNHQGIDEIKMRHYATWEASCGLRVLTPDIPPLRAYQIESSSIDFIGESARWFAQQTGHPITLMGVSFAGGMSLMAAAKPAFAPSVKMVFIVGAYNDLSRLANFYATGMDVRTDGSVEKIEPNPFGVQLLEYTDLALFIPAEDRSALEPVLGAVLFDEHSLVPKMVSALTPAQQAELKYLLDAVPNKTKLQEIAQHDAAEMASVSPHGHLAGLTAKVFLLHGLDDDYVPSAEAEWNAKELPPGTLQDMLISPVVSHITLGGKAHILLDKLRLIQFMARERRATLER
ncbi:MAG: alpha/beta hydrolase [Acidobacteriaceae bacterium]